MPPGPELDPSLNDTATQQQPQQTTDDSSSDERRNKTEAGVARGAARAWSRSTSTAAVRLPAVGRLPIGARPPVSVLRGAPTPTPISHHAVVMPRKLPVKQVAKVSDRVSQGMDLYDLAQSESRAATASPESSRVSKLKRFSVSMVKNTFLGMAVFETYGIVVERMAPVQKETASATVITTTAVNSKDPYARASVVVHCLAGALGGIAHGLVGTAWDAIAQWNVRANIKGPLNNNTTAANTANTPLAVLLSGAPRMIAHHTVAHAALFGSYEGIKRVLVSRMNDRMGHITTNLEVSDGAPFHDGSALPRKEPMTRVEYLGCVAIAGGLAGQVQHVVSSYSEQLLSMTTIPKWSNLILLKPLLLAFAPSSIAFVALEYGRRES